MTGRFGFGVRCLAALAALTMEWPAVNPRLAAAGDEAPPAAVLTRVLDEPFDEVVVHLGAAITSANFRITGENDIGSGLRQRGYADFPRYRIIHFCNLELAREGILIDRRLGAIMPCRAAVYEQDGHSVIAMTSAAAMIAPLANPALDPFRRKLEAAFARILADAAD